MPAMITYAIVFTDFQTFWKKMHLYLFNWTEQKIYLDLALSVKKYHNDLEVWKQAGLYLCEQNVTVTVKCTKSKKACMPFLR